MRTSGTPPPHTPRIRCWPSPAVECMCRAAAAGAPASPLFPVLTHGFNRLVTLSHDYPAVLLFVTMSSELLEAEMPPRPGAAAGGAAPPRPQRQGPPRPHQTGPAFELLPPFGKIGVCVAVQQEHVNAAVDSVLKYMSTNPEESVSSVLSAAYRLPRIAPFLARVVSTVAAADEDFHSAIVTR
jgi:hypothetical protein